MNAQQESTPGPNSQEDWLGSYVLVGSPTNSLLMLVCLSQFK